MLQRKIINIMLIVLILIFSLNIGSIEKNTNNSTIQPIAIWLFNSITNNTVIDDSGDNLTGILVNATITNGTSGNGVYFNGNDSYMMVHDSNYLHMSELTIALWYRPTPFNKYARLIGKGSNTTETFGIYIEQFSPDQYMIYTSYDGFFSGGGGYSLNNKWNFIVYTFSSENSTVYLGGELSSFTYAIYKPLLNNTEPLVLGEQINPTSLRYPFNGSIDDVRIYNRVLNQTEVNSLYTTEKPVNQLSSSLQSYSSTKMESSTSVSNTTASSQTSSVFTFNNNNNFLKNMVIDVSFLIGLVSISIFVAIVVSFLKYKKDVKNSRNISFRKYFQKTFNRKKKNSSEQRIPEEIFQSLEEIIDENI